MKEKFISRRLGKKPPPCSIWQAELADWSFFCMGGHESDSARRRWGYRWGSRQEKCREGFHFLSFILDLFSLRREELLRGRGMRSLSFPVRCPDICCFGDAVRILKHNIHERHVR